MIPIDIIKNTKIRVLFFINCKIAFFIFAHPLSLYYPITVKLLFLANNR